MKDWLLTQTERLKEAVGVGQVGLWDLRVDLGSIYFSPRWKIRLGLPDPDLAESIHFWRCRVHPDDLDKMLSAMRDHARGETARYDARFRFRSNGSGYRLLHSRGKVLERGSDGRARRLIGTSIDLTPRASTPGVGLPHGPRHDMSNPWSGLPFHLLLRDHADPGEAAERERALMLIEDLIEETLAELKEMRFSGAEHVLPP